MRNSANQFALCVAAMLSVGAASAANEQPVQKLPLPRTEAKCLAAGGEWILQGPQMVMYGCSLLKAKDGGKSCTTSTQCEGECVERPDGNKCAQYIDGCYQPTGRGTVTQCVN
jgi:hypothetical protein